jgi:hypothetical protein
VIPQNHIEELICLISTWDRPTLISQFMAFRSRFPVDFTPEFLQDLSVDRLRHVLFALYVQNQHIPLGDMAAA